MNRGWWMARLCGEPTWLIDLLLAVFATGLFLLVLARVPWSG